MVVCFCPALLGMWSVFRRNQSSPPWMAALASPEMTWMSPGKNRMDAVFSRPPRFAGFRDSARWGRPPLGDYGRSPFGRDRGTEVVSSAPGGRESPGP